MAQPDEQLICFIRVIRGWKILFRPRRFSEFLETRIIPERIEHRIEPEERRSERHVCGVKRAFVRCREQFLQGGDGAVGFFHPRRHSGKDLD